MRLEFMKTAIHDLDVPKRSTEGAGGFDLPLLQDDVTIWPGDQVIAKTGWAVSIPKGFVGFVWPRSKWAIQYGLSVGAGVIDSDYRGEIRVVLQRVVTRDCSGFNPAPLRLYKGDRVGQLVIVPYLDWRSEIVNNLDNTIRGEDGFGSTGR